MNIIKEFQKSSLGFQGRGTPRTAVTCFLRMEEPSCSLKTLTALFAEAQKDFPGLDESRVSVWRFGQLSGIDCRTAGQPGPASFDGIQFEVTGKPPASYKRLAPVRGFQG